MKAIVVSGLCLAIAGCNAPSRDSQFVASAGAVAPIQSFALGQPEAAVPAEAMLLLPVEAGGVLRVRERHFRNGTRQEIVLAGGTSGENILEVSVRTAGGDNAPRGELQIGKPSQRGVASETAGRFPGMAMHVVTRPMSNMFGPFGLAIGRRANGERCVFAWQWIEDIRAAASGSRSPLGSMLSGGAAPASVRLRMCRNNVTLDEMASYMEGLRPASVAAVDRIVRLDRRLIASGGVVECAGRRDGRRNDRAARRLAGKRVAVGAGRPPRPAPPRRRPPPPRRRLPDAAPKAAQPRPSRDTAPRQPAPASPAARRPDRAIWRPSRGAWR